MTPSGRISVMSETVAPAVGGEHVLADDGVGVLVPIDEVGNAAAAIYPHEGEVCRQPSPR